MQRGAGAAGAAWDDQARRNLGGFRTPGTGQGGAGDDRHGGDDDDDSIRDRRMDEYRAAGGGYDADEQDTNRNRRNDNGGGADNNNNNNNGGNDAGGAAGGGGNDGGGGDEEETADVIVDGHAVRVHPMVAASVAMAREIYPHTNTGVKNLKTILGKMGVEYARGRDFDYELETLHYGQATVGAPLTTAEDVSEAPLAPLA